MLDNHQNKENYFQFDLKLYVDVFKLGVNFPWDQKIAPVNQVWLLNQVLLNQEKLTL